MLKEGTDYQVIPGTNKPSLVKPGAEKLSTLFALSARFILAEKTEDWMGADHGGEPFFDFKYRCELYRGEQFIASCDGSCNSWEKKYRYRQAERVCPKCGKSTIIKGKDEYGGGWVCFTKKGGCGAKFQDGDKSIEGQQLGQIPNVDIFDQVNTLQKMSQKRAYVGAVLIATNASEYFTQDLEDHPEMINGEWKPAEKPAPVSVKPQPKPAPSPVAVAAELGGVVVEAPVSFMTLDMANSVQNSKGQLYGDCDTTLLNHMAKTIAKKIAEGGYEGEELEDKKMRLDACRTIIASRRDAIG